MKPPYTVIDYVGSWMATIGLVLLFAGLFIVIGRDIGWAPVTRFYIGAAAMVVIFVLVSSTSAS